MSPAQDQDELFDAVLLLSESDRLVLAHRILETLPDDLPGLDGDDPQFAAELLKRSGDAEGSVAWEELRDELRTSP